MFGAPGAVATNIPGLNWFLVGSGILLMLLTIVLTILLVDPKLIAGSTAVLFALAATLFWRRSR